MPNDDNHNAAAAAIVWQEAQRQIVRQEAELDSIRTRAVALLSVSALVAGLFGGRVLSHPHDAGVVIALVLFGASVAAVLVIIAPRWRWNLQQNLPTYFDRLGTGTLYPQDASMGFAQAFEEARIENNEKLGTVYWWFFAACVLTALEVVMWGVSLW